MIVIGITGTLGAGKGTIVHYLVKKKNFQHYSVRDFLVEEIKKRGMPVNRDSMVEVANDLRAKNSPGYIAEELFEKAENSGKDCVIESIRTEGEINSLRKKGKFYLFAVDADPKKRYERVLNRKSSTDSISFKEFIDNEKREMQSKDPNKQNLSKCISMADYVFDNNGTVEELYKKVEDVLDEIRKN
ncbi:MAG: AAA family ATPase [Candidatus Nanoarchaeia archaeon]|nr:AAA family ATPase [Candidatus Nanoarchaeia archaeon]